MENIRFETGLVAEPTGNCSLWPDNRSYWKWPPDLRIHRFDPPDSVRTMGSALNFGASARCDEEVDEMIWGEVVIAAQETSFAFLKNEPDLYTDADGEPL